ncbi:MATH and LRR domain-containing protein PFE0570w isoform X1 [Hydra vulgaris]|uniref:MATH and LRR domain-containing protein PFE0570w isoform X1 n=1 Tax=Hydra vulgaris TaxID=6087 RepID=UPI0032EA040D
MLKLQLSMTSASEIEDWFNAVSLYDEGKVENAIKSFEALEQNGRIKFNIGCSYLKLRDVQSAAKSFKEAISFDPLMAIAYYMIGLISCQEKEYVSAFEYFQKAIELLRGNRMIDYRQLGLNIQLYLCEILSNQAATYYYQDNYQEAKQKLLLAVVCKMEKKHDCIDDFLANIQAGKSITLFTPPSSAIYRPSKLSINNYKKKDYLGKAKVIAAENEESLYTCFSGKELQATLPKNAHEEVQAKENFKSERKAMLEQIRQPERKATLRKPKPVKQLPVPVDQELEIQSNLQTILSKPLFENASTEKMHTEDKSSENKFTENGCKPPCETTAKPLSPELNFEEHSISSENAATPKEYYKPSNIRPQKPLPKLTNDTNNNDHIIEHDASVELDKSTSLMNNNIFKHNNNTTLVNAESQELSNNNTRPTNIRSNTISEPSAIYKSLPFINNTNTLNIRSNSISEVSSEKKSKKLKNKLLHTKANIKEVLKYDSKNSKQESNAQTNSFEIEVQYAFVQKVFINENSSYGEIENLIKSRTIPQKIELCYNDELGRQQKLNENTMHEYFKNDPRKKIFCFSA